MNESAQIIVIPAPFISCQVDCLKVYFGGTGFNKNRKSVCSTKFRQESKRSYFRSGGVSSILNLAVFRLRAFILYTCQLVVGLMVVLTGMSLLNMGPCLMNEMLGDVHAERQGPRWHHTVNAVLMGFSRVVEQGFVIELSFLLLPLFILS